MAGHGCLFCSERSIGNLVLVYDGNVSTDLRNYLARSFYKSAARDVSLLENDGIFLIEVLRLANQDFALYPMQS